jgi:hypothetical protein
MLCKVQDFDRQAGIFLLPSAEFFRPKKSMDAEEQQ